jgi:ATP-dependent helicase/nuclease subunit B
MSSARALLLPPQADLAAHLAQAILARHRAGLPDLSRLTVLLPNAGAAPALRRQLGAQFERQGGGALLGPRLHTLQQFAAERGRGPLPVPAAECRLILVEALRQFRGLFPGQNPWQLAEALFSLFEELSLNAVSLPADEAAFAEQLAGAYGARPVEALSREAQIVHRLWQAFLEETQGRSPAAAYAATLRSAFAGMGADEDLWLAGCDSLAGAERAALAACPIPVALWLHGRAAGRDGAAARSLCAQLGREPQELEAGGSARSRFLDAVFGGTAPAEPAPPGLLLTVAEGPEHEARCVELAVREALLGGAATVAVVTEDRRLARRLRALLERAGIVLQDQGGWALSTSAAAAALHAWLDSAEQRFQFRPLLMLLKSGFFCADPLALRALERDLVYGQGVESGLDRYLGHAGPRLRPLLERLAEAARGLPSIGHGGRQAGRPRLLRDWMAGVERSLKSLGLWQRFGEDAAGRRLLEILAELDQAFAARPQSADWREFRKLLDRAIERATFVPPQPGRDRRVRLLTLEQSAGLRCEALILAGASRAQIPGPPPGEPFFNQSVRGELGLPNLAQRQALQLARLRRVLEAAPGLRITWAADQPGEPAQLSPWIEALESRAAAAGFPLRDQGLAARAGTAATEIAAAAARPALPRTRPRPAAPAARLPRELSATAHQRLVDCPYQFFASACLGLRAEQAPDEDPDRSDYGQRVHKILEAFTQASGADLPPPFGQAVTPANRAEAQARLEQIASAVFAPDLQSRALAHVWVTEFEGAIPGLLDWLEARPPGTVRAEVDYRIEFTPGLRLYGKADRVESSIEGGAEGLTVVDYKTGRPPARAEVESGESVQLLHYALLDEAVRAVEYLPLREGDRGLRLEADELDSLRALVGERLAQTLTRLGAGAPMPALGDSLSCGWCDFQGICRRRDWHEDRGDAHE